MSTARVRPSAGGSSTTRREAIFGHQLLPVAERIRLIEQKPLPRNIPALLDEAADEVPEHEVLHFIDSGESITYRDLRTRVEHLAAGMFLAGIKAGTHVAVMLPNIPAFPITWLALARLGAVMVPVNARYTGHELQYTLTDSESDYLIIHHEYLDTLSAMPDGSGHLSGRVYVVDGDASGHLAWSGLSGRATLDEAQVPQPDIDALINIQYTSGTTGAPKGCMLTQRYWLVCARTYSDWDFMSYPRILAGNPFFYMTPQWQLLMAFMQRGTLVVARGLSATHFLDWLRDYRINFCLFRNAYYRQPHSPLDASNDVIRVNIYERLKEAHLDMEARYDFPVRTGFGMTEIGAGMITPIEATDMTGSGTCGIAAPYRECRIADPEGNALPDGGHGELQIRGPGLFNGYYRRPDATAEAFHGDWFRTGDIACRDAQGYYYIVGRIKDMIRRAGENVAAAEVEAVLCEIPGISEAAVVGVPDAMRGEEIKAYVTLDPDQTPDTVSPLSILSRCGDRLAVYKLPRYIEYRQAPLPRTASGKIRKQELVKETPDLTLNSWDRVTGQWR